jgi:hypothetical protein
MAKRKARRSSQSPPLLPTTSAGSPLIEASRIDEAANPQPALGSGRRLEYNQFLEERQRIVEARQRTQQRLDQMITGGAAGALVLSITFIDTLAPTPDPSTRWILITAWVTLMFALALNLVSHFASEHAFNRAIDAWDAAFKANEDCRVSTPATAVAVWSSRLGAGVFVLGVALLAAFSFSNVRFVTNAPMPANSLTSTQEPIANEGATRPGVPADSPAADTSAGS